MQIESGNQGVVEAAVAAPSPASELSGYDKIALSVVRAIHFNTSAVIPLSVANRGNIRGLRDEDVVEVPCVVNANGARPMHVGTVPDGVAPLLARVKDYERRTVAAAPGAIDGSRPRGARPPIRSCRTAPPPTASSPSSHPYGDARSRHGPSAGHRDQHHRHGRRRPVSDDSVHGHRHGRAAHSLRMGVRGRAGALRRSRLRASSARRCREAAVRTSISARPIVPSVWAA